MEETEGKKEKQQKSKFQFVFSEKQASLSELLEVFVFSSSSLLSPEAFFWPRLPELSDLFEEASGDLRRRCLAETVELH